MGSVMSYNILLVEDETGIAEGIMDYMKESEITFYLGGGRRRGACSCV